jgi:DNA repair exonuclease SbcCD ATPase subunit
VRIEQIRLSNIACYTEKALDFDDLTVVYGENRTGKSTLVYALFFAMFGKHLNRHLKIADLARVGEPFGVARMQFVEAATSYRVMRSTHGLPKLLKYLPETNEWQHLALEDTGEIAAVVPVSCEVAALTSFFREGELIYFLRDMPKYNTTLLQNMVRMDNVFITHSRFKKALSMAREEQKRRCKTIEAVDTEALAEAVKHVETLEIQAQDVEKQLAELAPGAGFQQYTFLKQRAEKISEKMEIAHRKKTKFPETQALQQQISDGRKKLESIGDPSPRIERLSRELGKLDQELSDLNKDLQLLTDLQSNLSCRLCGQPFSESQQEALCRDKKAQHAHRIDEKKRLEAQLAEVQSVQVLRKTLEDAIRHADLNMATIEALDHQIKELTAEASEANQALADYRIQTPGIEAAEKSGRRKQELENTRSGLQRQIIEAKVAVRQIEENHRRLELGKKACEQAKQDTAVCDVAARALDKAIQALNSALLSKVRENIRAWADHFTFLDQFDINLTVNQLTPVIQAKGYQYKLNQMSKSERIFLYLMLKLAIGDALAHLGVFILDDPADGLDAKRKEMLAQLLAAVSKKRQIVVTTNDPVFADLFSEGRRIDL